jgi:O-antigen/teichoic acid export membrane protein
MNADVKHKKELLLKAQVYRVMALVAGGIGLLVFLYMVTDRADGNILVLLKDPYSILFFILPFLPAFVLSRVSSQAEAQLEKLLNAESPE